MGGSSDCEDESTICEASALSISDMAISPNIASGGRGSAGAGLDCEGELKVER
jgi:hypothetical protein